MGDDSRYIEFSGTYPANELYVTESRNEDGCRELIYTDKEGKKILARSMNGTEKIDTYFVYDFAGRLAVVITPEGTNEATIQNYKSIAISSAFVDTYCYYYHYDSRGSVTTKHIPGGAYEEMNYDSYCRLWRRWRGAKNTYWDEKYLEQYSYDQLNRIKEVAILVMPISAGITSSTYTRNPVTMSAYIYDNYKGVPAALDESSNPAFVANPRGEKTYEKLLLLESNTQIAVLSYYTERAFYYDKEGRLKRCVELNHRGGRSTIDYEYDFQGHTTRRTERIQPLTNAPVDVLDIRYTYDHVGRLLTQTSTLNTSDPVTVTCTYNELGQLERKNINGLIMDYTYNLQGWLIGQDSPYYSAKLKYYDGEYPSYAGNITEWTWGGAGTMPHTYKYRYDNLARMTGAWYSGDEGAQNYSERAIAYDDNGNILRMVRNLNDQLAYTYKGNQLQSVNNEKFEYDNCGNIIKDERNDLNITYNFLNLPWQVYRISNPSDRTLYSYLPDGTKLSSVDQTGNGLYYVGSLVYTGGRTTARLESAGFGDGRFRATTSSGRCLPEYYLTDHLGSIRALCDHTGELIALRDYYAFGMEWERPNAPATTDRYYYNGKEKQEIGNTGLLDYGARFYNPDIGRWTTLDPLASKYYNISPYAYCTGNPVRFIDIEGMFVGDPIKNPKIVRNRASNLYGEGIRILNGIRRTHQGFDYFAPIGTDVMAVKDGVVVQSKGYHVDYGKTITIEHKTEKGETVYTFYAHLSNVSVNDGDTVKEGEVIGKSGTTGNAASKGVKDQHLHFELRTQRQGARGLTGKKNPNEIVDTKFYSQNSDYPYQREIGVVKIDSEGKKEEMDVEN
ncbi:peptidoglycan DD-metalloendopeptidase family protein [Alistipes putredinis]|uniref:peptidoglycan DD-metalloendopeptidase family protein n=1 Tax=Alistipes putredinis TaxID=28117 RepID=UPI0024B1660B|nr:peptidoglycan DD-metalloendopeptidase family protein [Alistipes putredinis]